MDRQSDGPEGGVRQRKNKKVLLIEDDLDTRDGLEQILREDGYEATAVADGQVAWQHLVAGERPDIIVMDMLMPRADGWQLRRLLLSNPELARIPVVVISGLAVVRNSVMGLATAFLEKPFAPDLLLSTLSQIHSRETL
jgi:CheY-like chemotaxis protein